MFRRIAGLALLLGAAAVAAAQDPAPEEPGPPAQSEPADPHAAPAPPRVTEKVEVTARATTGTDEPAAIAVRPSEVLAVAGSADNIFRTLHTLPGVSPTDEFGSRLSVRGGTPDQNLTVMDGVEIHNPYRIFGLVSAFNPETVQSFELTAGAFSAKYGDNVLDRENVGYVEPYLEYDPTADRPRLLEKETASIPFLPSFGVRFRF